MRVRDAIDANYEALWRFLRRLGVNENDVEDAAQGVLLVFAQRIDGIKVGAERSFLLGSALRVASDARRKHARSREVASSDAIDERASPLLDAEQQLEQRQRRRWLDEVLDALPDDLRAVLVLVDLEEQTMADAALILEIPAGTVASRIRRARELFEELAMRIKTRIEGGSQ